MRDRASRIAQDSETGKTLKKSSAQIEAIGCDQQRDEQPGGAAQGNLPEDSGTGWREGKSAGEDSCDSSHLRPPDFEPQDEAVECW